MFYKKWTFRLSRMSDKSNNSFIALQQANGSPFEHRNGHGRNRKQLPRRTAAEKKDEAANEAFSVGRRIKRGQLWRSVGSSDDARKRQEIKRTRQNEESCNKRNDLIWPVWDELLLPHARTSQIQAKYKVQKYYEQVWKENGKGSNKNSGENKENERTGDRGRFRWNEGVLELERKVKKGWKFFKITFSSWIFRLWRKMSWQKRLTSGKYLIKSESKFSKNMLSKNGMKVKKKLWAERSEAKNAKRRFASKIYNYIFCRKASLHVFSQILYSNLLVIFPFPS